VRTGVALALLGIPYGALVLGLWSTVYPVNDYAGIVAGARALLAGVPPYDSAHWPDAWQQLGTQRPDTAVFGYPPWVAVAFIPLAPLPLVAGSLLWSGGTLALATIGIVRVARRFGWRAPSPYVLLVLASWPALLVFLQGQWLYLLFALACGCLLDLTARRDLRAGAWWGIALLAKPQLLILGSLALAAWSIGARRPRVIAGALVTVLAAAVSGTLAAPDWLGPWLGQVATARLARSTQQPTLAGLAGDVAGDAWPLLWGAAAVGLAGFVALAIWRGPLEQRGPIAFAGGLALSLATALYSWSYDQYLVLLAGAATLALAGAWPPSARRTAVVAGVFAIFGPLAVLLFISAYLRWHDTLAGLVPPLAIALLAYAASQRPRRDRSEAPGA